MNFIKAIETAAALVTNHNPQIPKLTHLTLVKGVSKKLEPQHDFNLGGSVVDSLPAEEFKKKYAGKTIHDIDSCEATDFKVMWSNSPISETDENAPFLPHLTIRFVSCCSEMKVAEFLALRNRFGSSLVRLPLPEEATL